LRSRGAGVKVSNEDKLALIEKVALELYEKYGDNVIVKTPHFTISASRPVKQQEIDKYSFNEAYSYLANAKRRFNAKTPEGYSDCKANCRNALMSALEALTSMSTIKEAAKELHRQRILGEREEEFIKTFDELLVILHGIDSKRGSHPPMTRNESDAELALNLTTSVVKYIINQATKPRD
jgi:hypothetical protein